MLFAVLGAVVVFAYFTTFSRPVTTVILVRHAEKKIEPNNQDPDLTPEGVERAQEIARMFGEAGINAIYATQYKRTQQTVKPLSDRTGVPVDYCRSRVRPIELVNQIQTSQSRSNCFYRRPQQHSARDCICAERRNLSSNSGKRIRQPLHRDDLPFR